MSEAWGVGPRVAAGEAERRRKGGGEGRGCRLSVLGQGVYVLVIEFAENGTTHNHGFVTQALVMARGGISAEIAQKVCSGILLKC